MLDCVLGYSADLSHPHIMTFEWSITCLGSILYRNLLKTTSGEGVSRDRSIVGETLEFYLFTGLSHLPFAAATLLCDMCMQPQRSP